MPTDLRFVIAAMIGGSGLAVMWLILTFEDDIGLPDDNRWPLLAVALGGALLSGLVTAPLFGRPGRKGHWLALLGALSATAGGAALAVLGLVFVELYLTGPGGPRPWGVGNEVADLVLAALAVVPQGPGVPALIALLPDEALMVAAVAPAVLPVAFFFVPLAGVAWVAMMISIHLSARQLRAVRHSAAEMF